MDRIAILFAKIGGLQKNFKAVDWGRLARATGARIDHLIQQYDSHRKGLMELLPELYADMPLIPLPQPIGKTDKGDNLYQYSNVVPIVENIDYILEVRSNYRIGEKTEEKSISKRIFITHGRSKEWYKVQNFLEKDLGYSTLELAQEANQGRTVLQKLAEESDKCGCAVIVMTGDDIVGDEKRARENVMHEIGFFQGKYGLQNIILLHEEGVSIPSNIHGLVYIPFPKETVEATFGGLQRELKIIIQ
jgi:predicted nucleotide-binding protein